MPFYRDYEPDDWDPAIKYPQPKSENDNPIALIHSNTRYKPYDTLAEAWAHQGTGSRGMVVLKAENGKYYAVPKWLQQRYDRQVEVM